MSEDQIHPVSAIGDWAIGWVEIPAPAEIEGWSTTWFRHPEMAGMYGLAAWKRDRGSTFYQRLVVSEELIQSHGTKLVRDQLDHALAVAPPPDGERR